MNNTTTAPQDFRKAALRRQIRYYFSPKNLANDQFMQSVMDDEGYVPIQVIADFKRVRQMTSDLQFVVEIMTDCEELQVDQAILKVRLVPLPKDTLILFNIPRNANAVEVYDMFDFPECRPIKTVKFDGSDAWYITFDTEHDCLATAEFMQQLTFRQNPVSYDVTSFARVEIPTEKPPSFRQNYMPNTVPQMGYPFSPMNPEWGFDTQMPNAYRTDTSKKERKRSSKKGNRNKHSRKPKNKDRKEKQVKVVQPPKPIPLDSENFPALPGRDEEKYSPETIEHIAVASEPPTNETQEPKQIQRLEESERICDDSIVIDPRTSQDSTKRSYAAILKREVCEMSS